MTQHVGVDMLAPVGEMQARCGTTAFGDGFWAVESLPTDKAVICVPCLAALSA